MTCYGLAFLLVLWNGWKSIFRIARIGFLVLLFLLCGWPMIYTDRALRRESLPIRWPPYVPPYIAVLNDWMKPDEITASDMPWAIAWYADRRALWLPETVHTMTEYERLPDFGRTDQRTISHSDQRERRISSATF